MAQWTKRRASDSVRPLIIGFLLAFVVATLYLTGILEQWLGDTSVGFMMLLSQNFWMFVMIFVLLFGMIFLCVRSTINWGGA